MLDFTHIHRDTGSGPSSGRRLVALTLCILLVLGTIAPGFAVAREDDSEGEGTGPTVELPLPDFDPGGEETGLEESSAPAGGEEEPGPVEPEADVEIEAPPAEEVVGAPAAEPPVEAPAPAPTPEPSPPAYEPAPEEAPPAPSEPVANETITAPPSAKVSAGSGSASKPTVQGESPAPLEPEEQEAPPSSPQPVPAPAADPGRSLAGRDTYVVRPGDCLWHIAAALLPPGADTQAIEQEVARLWTLNEDRIGTGDPNLIYTGTTLRLS